MSTRLAVKLNSAIPGVEYVFVGGNGKKRNDGKTNANRMFRSLKTGKAPYFKELRGPWIETLYAVCAVAADITGDGLDDLILCDKNGPARIFVQTKAGLFRKMNLPTSSQHVHDWRNVRVGPVMHRGKPDLVVVGAGKESSYLSIFKGTDQAPYFDFKSPVYNTKFPYATPDIELIDVNDDTWLDIYVVQANEKHGYCATGSAELVKKYFGGRVNPPDSYMPPIDKAQDVLMIADGKKYNNNNNQIGFQKVKMNHARPGCGGIVERFGNMQTISLAQGRPLHLGHNLILEW